MGSAAQRRGQGRLGLLDPADSVALVARARRRRLLWAHRYKLPRADLEDCYSQATLELIARAKRGVNPFASDAHVHNALEQRFLSRILDRQRAISGRSPIETALFWARPLADDTIDPRADSEKLLQMREQLRAVLAVAGGLSDDQRLLLVSQIDRTTRPEDFCRRHGWSIAKYRKVSQRARARLRKLLADAESQTPVPPKGGCRTSKQGPTYAHISPAT
jgi:DNA-directed RNA polymerase specialized sigma24 family protein